MAIHNPTKEGLDQHEYSSPPIKLPFINSIPLSKYALGCADYFLISRQLERQEIGIDLDEAVGKWFQSNRIRIEPITDTSERVTRAKRLFYTWRGYFAENVCDVKATNLIIYSMNYLPKTHPVMGKIPKYTTAKHAFANEIYPQMEDGDIITR